MSMKVFRACVLYAVSRMLREPSPPSPLDGSLAESIPGGPHYQLDTLLRPCGEVGGDWLGGDLLDDNTLWILIADVCGKGYPASILARGLPLLWRIRSANNLRRRKCEPVELLNLLGAELNRCLPDGVFVEATAARLDPLGQVLVGAAGFTRVLSRQCGSPLHCFAAVWRVFLGDRYLNGAFPAVVETKPGRRVIAGHRRVLRSTHAQWPVSGEPGRIGRPPA